MTRKLFSLAGVLVAVFSFTVGSSDVEARHCRSQRNRCCNNGNQYANRGYQNQVGNGQCCQQSGSNGYQQNTNYGYRNDGFQQAGNNGQGQATYGSAAVSIDAGQPAAAVQATAPVPNN